MQLQSRRLSTIEEASTNDVAERERLLQRVEAANNRSKAYVVFGRQLYSVLSGRADPLQLLFSDGLAEDFYADLFSSISAGDKVRRYLDVLAFKNPAIDIL
jgi:hypothetical protein